MVRVAFRATRVIFAGVQPFRDPLRLKTDMEGTQVRPQGVWFFVFVSLEYLQALGVAVVLEGKAGVEVLRAKLISNPIRFLVSFAGLAFVKPFAARCLHHSQVPESLSFLASKLMSLEEARFVWVYPRAARSFVFSEVYQVCLRGGKRSENLMP